MTKSLVFRANSRSNFERRLRAMFYLDDTTVRVIMRGFQSKLGICKQDVGLSLRQIRFIFPLAELGKKLDLSFPNRS